MKVQAIVRVSLEARSAYHSIDAVHVEAARNQCLK